MRAARICFFVKKNERNECCKNGLLYLLHLFLRLSASLLGMPYSLFYKIKLSIFDWINQFVLQNIKEFS